MYEKGKDGYDKGSGFDKGFEKGKDSLDNLGFLRCGECLIGDSSLRRS